MNLASIVLFTYNRPDHTQITVEALSRNPLANKSDLIVYSDAARSQDKQETVNAVRRYLSTISGFLSVKVIHRPNNFGLAKSIIQGVTETLQQVESVIVLEDDMITSPHFLAYMNQALEQYADDDRVISIHGYVYPVKQKLPESFFLRGADCWGWATWRRGWKLFNRDGQYLLDKLEQGNLIRSFDFNGTYSYSKMLKEQIKGINNSWAIRWYASAFLANKLTLYPGRSLVHNIGNDNSGTHCAEYTSMNTELSDTSIRLDNITVESSEVGRQAFISFFKKSKNGLIYRLYQKIYSLFKSKFK